MEAIDSDEPKQHKQKQKHVWDRDLDYEDTRGKLVTYINQNEHDVKGVMYCLIALTGLDNGSRPSESVEAFRRFLENPQERIVLARTRKRADRINRDMVIPLELWLRRDIYQKLVWNNDFAGFKHKNGKEIEVYRDQRVEDAYANWLIRHFGWNPHSFRFSKMNYWRYKQGKDIGDIASRTMHKSVNQLFGYFRLKEAQKRSRELIAEEYGVTILPKLPSPSI